MTTKQSNDKTCRNCTHSEGGHKRECDGVHLFCQNEDGVHYMKEVAPDGVRKCFKKGE